MSKSKKPNTVILSTAITVDGKDVTEVQLRQPKAGELRGLKITEVLQMDVNAMMALLPRITTPTIIDSQISALSPADLTSLASEAVLFFVSPSKLKEIQDNS